MSELFRRGFLRGFVGALVALPALEACSRDPAVNANARSSDPARTRHAAQALAGATAKRFIGLMAPDGVVPSYWFPTGGETGITLGRHTKPLETHKDNLLFMKGVDDASGALDYYDTHIGGVTSFLTGYPALPIDVAAHVYAGGRGISIDQHIAQLQRDAGYLGKVSSVQFGEQGFDQGFGQISYAGNAQPTAMMTPVQAFELLFDGTTLTQEAMGKARSQQKSILDGTLEDYTRLSQRVSGEDKRRIDAHLEGVRDIEKRLESTVVCTKPDLVTTVPNGDSYYDDMRKLYYDLLVAAMTCDATRVATVAFAHCGGGGPAIPSAGVTTEIHQLSHDIVDEGATEGPGHAQFDKYHNWYSGRVAYLVDQMKNVTLPDGKTLFDETVLFQGSDISFNHDYHDMPYLIIAGSATPFRTGRYVQFPSVPHNHLLVTIAHAFGGTVTSFGDPRIAPGNLDANLLA